MPNNCDNQNECCQDGLQHSTVSTPATPTPTNVAVLGCVDDSPAYCPAPKPPVVSACEPIRLAICHAECQDDANILNVEVLLTKHGQQQSVYTSDAVPYVAKVGVQHVDIPADTLSPGWYGVVMLMLNGGGDTLRRLIYGSFKVEACEITPAASTCLDGVTVETVEGESQTGCGC